mmetsp:Transcript_9807/g.11376  ORF Transcript_9807/g.11376 Transcript_9807/m.11376 type:complete len:103 (+) Transcript_9807:336-644(+)
MIVIVILFLQAVFLPKLYNDFHCLFRMGEALLLLILLSDSGGLDSDTFMVIQCTVYVHSLPISLTEKFAIASPSFCQPLFLSSQSHQIQILSSRDPTTIWIH